MSALSLRPGIRRSRGLYYGWIRPIGAAVIKYSLLIAASATVLLPLGWMLTVALKADGSTFFTNPVQWFPIDQFHWENFGRALFNPDQPFALYFFNTLWLEVFIVFGTVVSCALVAYPFARLTFPGRNFLFSIVILTMLIPWQGLMVPQFLLFYNLGWYGTNLPLIVPSFAGSAFFVFLIRQYMRSIPLELDDAARLDGAGPFRIFWSVILPLAKPALTTCAVLTFLAVWSDLLGPIIYLTDDSQYTLAVGLSNFVSTQSNRTNLLMAANLITIIPVAIIYFFAQKQLIGGIASVGLKG